MTWVVWTVLFLSADFALACVLGKAIKQGMLVPATPRQTHSARYPSGYEPSLFRS